IVLDAKLRRKMPREPGDDDVTDGQRLFDRLLRRRQSVVVAQLREGFLRPILEIAQGGVGIHSEGFAQLARQVSTPLRASGPVSARIAKNPQPEDGSLHSFTLILRRKLAVLGGKLSGQTSEQGGEG